jgi:hypothetical protein
MVNGVVHDCVTELIKSFHDLSPYLIYGMVHCFKIDKRDHFFVVTYCCSCTDISLKVLWYLVADLTYELNY